MELKLIKWLIGVLIGAFLFMLLNPFVIITAGERGIVMNMGAVSENVLGEGLHMRVPFVQAVKVLDVKIQKETVTAGAASKDLQQLRTIIALNYHLDPSLVNQLYQKIGMQYKDRIIDPAIQEAVKAATAKYTAEEAITKRALVREDIKTLITGRLEREYIIVDEVSITDFDFSNEFNKAIEAKVTAEQQALQAKNVLEQKKFEAEQRITTARAEAEAIKLQSEAANNEKYVALKALEVQSEAVKKWDGHLPTQMIPGSSVPFIKIEKDK